MSLKLKIRSIFPALVSALSPLTLVKQGLVYVFGIDISALRTSLDPIYALIGAVPPFPPVFYVNSYMPAAPTRTQTTAAINAAIAACLAAGGGRVVFGRGSYLTNDQIIGAPRVDLVGQGKGVTIIDFLPTIANKAAIYLANGASSFVGRVSNLTIYSADTSFVKFGILCFDGRDVEIDHVQISGAGSGGTWHDTTNASRGIYLFGRDGYNIHDVTSYADLPFYFAVNPNLAGAIIDQSHFWNITVYSGVSNLVTINGGIVANMTWDGRQEWLGGTTGLSWIDAVSTTFNSPSNVFKNIRLEQAIDPTAWSFDIEGNAAANVYINAKFENIQGGDRKGWKLRNVANAGIKGAHFIGTAVAYDINSTVYGFIVENSFWINGQTISVSGQTLVGPFGYGVAGVTDLDASQTIPSNAIYQNNSGIAYGGNFGALTTGVTATASDNSTKLATTAYVDASNAAQGTAVTITPVWTSTGTAPSLGNGTLTGKVVRLGPALILASVKLTFGSTTTGGTGTWQFRLPAPYNGAATSFSISRVHFSDSGVADYYGDCEMLVADTNIYALYNGTANTATTPFTWGTGDYLEFSLPIIGP